MAWYYKEMARCCKKWCATWWTTPSTTRCHAPTSKLQVEDTGPGVPAAERDLVFQPFYRALGNEADGSGLGLPIVLEIAHQHRATVSVEDSRPGQIPPGACFTVRFSVLNG